MLGPNLKYSSCFYKEAASTLQEAEEEALRQTVEHADLADGQSILELGCGWGSLSLWMARQFPHANVVAVSSSHSQREYIEREADRRGLTNLRLVTSDINTFDPQVQFDRIVSVEMFEHIMNWRELLTRLKSWLNPDGRVLMHIFTHRSGAYRFDRADREDWIAQHFFSGGVMPSHHLIRHYADLFAVEKEWRWSGTHYQRTAQDWLANFDARHDAIEAILRESPWRGHRVVDAPLALVLSRHRRPVRLRRWQRMGHQPLPAEDGVVRYPRAMPWNRTHNPVSPQKPSQIQRDSVV